jgi:hypothetical protein
MKKRAFKSGTISQPCAAQASILVPPIYDRHLQS